MRRPAAVFWGACLALNLSAGASAQTVPHQWVNLEYVVVLDFLSLAGPVYALECSTDLSSPTHWVPSGTLIAGNGSEMYAFDPNPVPRGKSYRLVLGEAPPGPGGPVLRAEDCRISALEGNFAYVDAPGGREVLVSTDPAGDPTYAVGETQFYFPGAVSNGTYTLSVHWRSGTVAGTPWAFMLGSDSGSVIEDGVSVSGGWHYFYPGQSGSHSDQVFTHDLAGPDPVDFSMWVNSPVAASITVSGVGADDFYVRVWDMSPARDNYFAIEYFELNEVP